MNTQKQEKHTKLYCKGKGKKFDGSLENSKVNSPTELWAITRLWPP